MQSPNEFDIFQILKHHNKDKNQSNIIERHLKEIEERLKKDIKLLEINLSSTELRTTVVERIQKKINYLESRFIYWRNAKKMWTLIFLAIMFVIAIYVFGAKFIIEPLLDIIEQKNIASNNLAVPTRAISF